MLFSQKVVWITGASSGIGEATAYEIAKLGANLVISSNQPAELEQVRHNCVRLGVKCLSIEFDLTDPTSISEAVKTAINEYGKIDILFNNGGLSQRSFIVETPIEIDRKLMEINYFGGIWLTKNILPYMIKNGGGQIAVTTSISGKFGFPLRSAYCASKFALYGFYETLRLELEERNISITFICPGRVQTDISFHALDKEGKPHGVMDEGQKNGIPVEKAAKQIVKAIIQKKREAMIGGKELLMVSIKKYIPFLFYKIVKKIKST